MHLGLISRKLRILAPRGLRTPSLNRHQLLQDVFQRIPPFSQIAVLMLAIWGPTHAPLVFSTVMMVVMLTFVASNARTAWGMRFACNAVEQCAATNWRESSGNVDEFDSIHHLIILPHYKESLDTLRETLSVLASHPAARASYVICLASEMAEAGVTEKVLGLMEEFGACFLEIVFSLHPRNLPGEAAGKSSNVAWAARDMHSRHKAGDIITVMDADSCFAADFFAAAASKYTRADVETRRSLMFVAPIFFDRNADDVAAPVVCTDILWCAAGLGTMYDGSLAKLPTSAYAMSTMLAARIGFWDAGPEAIGEDLHMSVKAFFETSGTLVVEPIFSPASQCNVVGFRFPRDQGQRVQLWQQGYEWGSDLFARYAQAKRHMWGALDSGYAIRRLALGHHGVDSDLPRLSEVSMALEDGLRRASMGFDARDRFIDESIPPTPTEARSQSPDSSAMTLDESEEGFSDLGVVSQYTSPPSSTGDSPLLRATQLKTNVPASYLTAARPAAPLPLFKLAVMMSRLYEAHFNLGYLFILMSIAPYFNPGLEPTPLWKLRPATEAAATADALPDVVLLATAVAAQLGTVAFVCTALIFYYYEQFHHITTTKRWEGQSHLGQRANQQAIRSFPWCIKTYTALPFTLLFGILPLYHAQMCHIWSNRLTYQVSAKPSAPPGTARYTPIPMADLKTSMVV